MKLVNGGALSDSRTPRFRAAMQLIKASEDAKAKADAKQNDINREHDAAAQARNEASQAQQRIEQSQREKAEAESRLNGLRVERQAREAAEAKRRADEEAAKAAAEAKRKADAEAKAKAEEKVKDEKDVLTKTSELIADMGEKIGEQLGEKYKGVANEIANDIRNFQGKTIRSYEQAMASLNKITSNPGMKINKGDKDAIINAWKSLNADDMANKLGNLSKAFKAADVVMKIEKVREKSIEGYETGNWGPLMLEVESWVLGGMAAGVALGLFGAILSALPISGLALTAISIIGIMTISYLASKIDDKMVENINSEVIRSAN